MLLLNILVTVLYTSLHHTTGPYLFLFSLCRIFHYALLVPFWTMTIYSDNLHWSGITPILTLLLIWTFLPNLTFYLIARGFHTTFATGAACQQRTLTPPDTWSCPTLGLASVRMLRLISPELSLFLDFWVSNIPRYFRFLLTTVSINDFIQFQDTLAYLRATKFGVLGRHRTI